MVASKKSSVMTPELAVNPTVADVELQEVIQ